MALADLEKLPGVKEVRQCGFIAGVELEESLNGLRPGSAVRCLYRGASPWTADQANRQCRRSDAAIMHHDRSVN